MRNGIGANLIMTCRVGALQYNVGPDEDIRDLSVGIYCILHSHEYVLVPNWVGGL